MTYEFVSLDKADDGKHKYKVILLNKETKRNKTIKFGAEGMMDYTLYYKKDGQKVADEHKRLYKLRHGGMGETYNKSGVDTAGFWAMHLLWNLPSVKESLVDIIKKYF